MRVLISLHFSWITSCLAAFVAQNRVMPLILQASNTTTMFSSRLSNFAVSPQDYTRNNLRNPRFSWGGGELRGEHRTWGGEMLPTWAFQFIKISRKPRYTYYGEHFNTCWFKNRPCLHSMKEITTASEKFQLWQRSKENSINFFFSYLVYCGINNTLLCND